MINIQGIAIKDLKPGSLYLIFDDGTRVDFIEEEIREKGYRFLDDPSLVPDSVRKAAEFQRCSVCPERHQQGYCHALLPTLSSIEKIDKYPSFTPVTSIYKDRFSDELIIRQSSLQEALHCISILSLIYYCELGRECRDLFFKVNPIMDPQDVAARIYLNLYWQSGADEQKIAQKLGKFIKEIKVTIDCQVQRLRLICKKDAFINAFTITHVLTTMLERSPENSLKKSMGEYQAKLI